MQRINSLLTSWSSLVLLLALTCTANAQVTRQVTDDDGNTVTVPANPQRIVAVSEVDLDALLALGMEPVATLNGRGQNAPTSYLLDQLSDVEIVGEFYQPNLELLLSVEPDLILAGGFPIPTMLELLPEVAPTLITYDIADPWKESFRKIAEQLDKLPEYEAFMADYHSRVEVLAQKLRDQEVETVSIVRWNPNGPVYMLQGSFGVDIMNDLGLKQPEGQTGSGGGHSDVLSLEALHLIDGDFIYFGTLAAEGDAFDTMIAGLSSAPYQQLNAVREGNVLQVDGALFTSMGGPLGAMTILDVIESSLLD